MKRAARGAAGHRSPRVIKGQVDQQVGPLEGLERLFQRVLSAGSGPFRDCGRRFSGVGHIGAGDEPFYQAVCHLS